MSTLGRENSIWIRTYKGHWNKRHQQSFWFIFVPFLNLDTKFSQNLVNQAANPLYSFWEPIWDNYSENTESAFRSRDYPFTIFLSIICIFTNEAISKVSLFRSSSFLGVLWEANMSFEKKHIWRTWKQR